MASLGCFVHPTGWWRSITRAEPARTVVLLPGEPMLPCQGGFPTSSWEFWRCRQEQRCPVHPRHGQMVQGALCGCPASWSCHISRSIFGSEAPRRLQPAPQPCYTVPSSSSVAEEPPGDFQSPARQDRGLALPAGSGDARAAGRAGGGLGLAPRPCPRRARGLGRSAAGTGVGAAHGTKTLLERSWAFHVF